MIGRDWSANVTTLSGDNKRRVILASQGLTSATLLDGFTITEGNAGGAGQHGGGIFCDGRGTGNICSPTLSNLIFSRNTAQDGGALYNDALGGGTSSPTLSYVLFSDNKAARGGAIFNNGVKGGTSSPILNNVTFTGNSAQLTGGAMTNNAALGTSSPILTNVTFTGNSAAGGGGAMDNSASGATIGEGNTQSGTCNPQLYVVTFSGNKAQTGGAMYNFSNRGTCSPLLVRVVFAGNSASADGGAVYNEALAQATSSPTFINVVFSGNSGNFGGAVYNYGKPSVSGSGGTCSPTFTNATFSGNRAAIDGGALFNFAESLKKGEAKGRGASNPRLANTILWDNRAGGEINQIANLEFASATVSFSLVKGPAPDKGEGNISIGVGLKRSLFIDPVDPASAPTISGDLRLMEDSTAIDIGSNDVFPKGIIVDLDGKKRIAGDAIDVGAYEFQ